MVSTLYYIPRCILFGKALRRFRIFKDGFNGVFNEGAALDNLLSISNMIPKLTFYVIFLLFTVFTGFNRVINFEI